MNLQDKILKAIKKGLNTAFNFDDIADTRLDDIKTEPTKNSADTVKFRWSYYKLAQFVSEVLNKNDLELTLEEQNNLFENCVFQNIFYLFPDNETFKKFIQKYCNTNIEANLNWIDTSNITDMSCMFADSHFNGDISKWNVSSVTDMSRIFEFSNFNGDISSWDVSSVTDMHGMFYYSQFTGDISQWDVSNVKDMHGMFYNSQFNGDISQWDVSNVKDMHGMFYNSQFNRNISQWDVSSVTNMCGMFKSSKFNRNISSWNVSSVTDMSYMFEYCPIELKFKPHFKKWIYRIKY